MHSYSLLISLLLLSTTISAHKLSDFGAIPNDPSDPIVLQNGKALASALDAANSSPEDRTVLIESSYTYHLVPTGVISGLSDIVIQIEGQLIAWDGPVEDWPRDEFNHSIALISLNGTRNVTIRGNGLIDGLGYRWWWHVILEGDDYRPYLIEMGNCDNTLIEGLTFSNAPEYHLFLMNMRSLVVQNINVVVDINGQKDYLSKAGFLYNNWIPTFPLNTDGIDISGIDIIIRNCTFVNFDDAVAVKPLHEGQSLFTDCTQNILIENCNVRYGVGMSMGSLAPHVGLNCIKNVTIRNVVFETPIKAIYVKSNPGVKGEGLFSNILYENIEITGALLWGIWIGPQQQHQPHGFSTGCSFFYPLPFTECPTNPLVTFEDITLRNVTMRKGVFSPGVILCNSANPCRNIVFDGVNAYDFSIVPYWKGVHCENAEGKVLNSNLVPDCLEKI